MRNVDTSGNDKGMGGKITRLEVIDHTSDGEGRAYHKWAKEPFSVTYDIQDDGRTVKVFLGNPEWGIDLLATDPDDDVEATSNVQPNLTLDKTIEAFVHAINNNPETSNYIGFSEDKPAFDRLTQDFNHLITQARISELEKLALDVGAFPDDIANYGGELLGKWSERKLTHSKIEDRIKELSE